MTSLPKVRPTVPPKLTMMQAARAQAQLPHVIITMDPQQGVGIQSNMKTPAEVLHLIGMALQAVAIQLHKANEAPSADPPKVNIIDASGMAVR